MGELNEEIIRVGLKICKRNEGGIVVVGDCEYMPMVEQEVKSFDVIKNPKLFESLILMDGGVILSKEGFLKAYGVKIKSNFTFKNFGTRTSAGYSASMKDGTTVYVISQENSKIYIFQKGKMIMEIDGRTKDIEKKIPEISNIMESVGYGTFGTVIGVAVAPAIGLVAIPGITIFVVVTGVSYALKKFKEMGWIK